MNTEGELPSVESPLTLPFYPTEIPDRVGLTVMILASLAEREPGLDPTAMLDRASRIVTSLGFLAGANESWLTHGMDAYLRCGEYGLRVLIEDGSSTLDY